MAREGGLKENSHFPSRSLGGNEIFNLQGNRRSGKILSSMISCSFEKSRSVWPTNSFSLQVVKYFLSFLVLVYSQNFQFSNIRHHYFNINFTSITSCVSKMTPTHFFQTSCASLLGLKFCRVTLRLNFKPRFQTIVPWVSFRRVVKK